MVLDHQEVSKRIENNVKLFFYSCILEALQIQ